MNPQALIFPADEDGANNVSNDENTEEDVVEPVVVLAIENGEKDQASRTNNGSDGGADGIDLLPCRSVLRESARVS